MRQCIICWGIASMKLRLVLVAAAIAGAAASVTMSAARAEDIISMISQYRRAHGLPAVHADPALMAVAHQQARAMASRGIMDHNVGGSFASRVAGANVGHAGENIAMGQKSWADALRAWKSSSGHNHNLLMPGATRIGVAVSYGGSRNTAYWAMVIGGGAETRRVRMANGRGGYVMGVPLMSAVPSRSARRSVGTRDTFSRKGEINGTQ